MALKPSHKLTEVLRSEKEVRIIILEKIRSKQKQRKEVLCHQP